MIYDDIRSELTAIDELRKRTTEDMVDAEMRLLETAQRKSPRSATAGPKAPTRAASENPQDRSQALFIRRLVKEGKLETAVSILKSMKARDAAAILASLDDVDAPLAERLAAALPTDRETIRR
jgi:pentatricopeptide repeat protein